MLPSLTQELRFSQHHLELVSKEEYRLGRPLPNQHQQEEEEEGAGSGGHGNHHSGKERTYGLILKKGGR